MSEGILKALMQLFALVSSPNQNDEVRRSIVKDYLAQQLNNKLVEEYLLLFDEFVKEHQSKLKERDKIQKVYSASSVKVLKIATSINEELTHYQKLIVLIQLLEFLHSGASGISVTEIEFVNTIAVTFNIYEPEYLAIFNFVNNNFLKEKWHNDLIIVTGNPDFKNQTGYLFREHLRDELYFLNIRSANLLLLKSKKGSDLTLNGQILQQNRIHFLRPGSSIRHSRISPITYTDIFSRFHQDVQSQPFTFEVKEISFRYKRSQTALHPMSFTTESGRLVGIMGDSGAGKSTLINVLTGIYHPQRGEVTINGINIHKNPAKVKGLIGYVSQDDLLMEDLTVMQNLYYNAKLCFDHLSTPNIKRKVTKLLVALGLYDIRHMKVGSPLNPAISGGQRKRLNIALELIREPAVMFLDEPTSGLSSRDSENIMDLLKELSLKGKLIFVVIHQPSSDIFKMLDQLLVLDTGGYLVYNGDAVESINYFKKCINHVNREETECPLCGNVSPEQILTILNSHIMDEYGNPTPTRKIAADEWYKSYKDHQKADDQVVGTTEELPPINFSIPNRFKQLSIFLTRDVLSKLVNRQYLFINLLESPVLALILASLILYFEVGTGSSGEYIFYKNPNLTVYNIIAIIIAIFIGLSVSAEEIISDRKILKRESFLSLSRFSYIVSKVIILACLSAIQTGLFVLVGNSILEIKGMGFNYWIILFSSSVFANLLGLNISDSFKKTVNIYILIPFLIIPQLILSGVFVSYDQLNPNLSSTKNIPWYGELITARWAFEAIAVENYKSNEYQKNFFVNEKLKSIATYRKDFWLPELKNQLKRYDRLESEKEKMDVLKLISNELTRHNNKNMPGLHFANTNLLTTEKFDTIVRANLMLHLDSIRSFYVGLYRKADEGMEFKKQDLMRLNGGEAWLTNLRNEHHNEGLERFVRRSNDIFSSRVIQYDYELIQKFDPVFEDPEHPFIKSHFLASSKNINGKPFDTFVVNLIIIWILNSILFVLLYAALFRKFSIWGSSFKRKYERFINKKKLSLTLPLK